MKKIYKILLIQPLLALLNLCVHADIITISATDYQFSPANVNANVGDVIRFSFAGYHNATTNGVTKGLPTGAEPIYSGTPGDILVYEYIVAIPGNYKYICEIHGDAGTYSGMKGQLTVSGTIPIVLRDLTIASVEKKPLLTWATETEVNADHFSIRSSTDALHFTEIGKVNSTGNSSTKRWYSFTDNSSYTKRFIYYAIAAIDKDGREKLSAIKIFKNDLATKKLITGISPNPITRPGQLMIYFNAEKEGAMKVKVFNAAGKLVLNTNMAAFPGLNSGHVHVCDLNAGIYTLEFTMNGYRETKRVLVN